MSGEYVPFISWSLKEWDLRFREKNASPLRDLRCRIYFSQFLNAPKQKNWHQKKSGLHSQRLYTHTWDSTMCFLRSHLHVFCKRVMLSMPVQSCHRLRKINSSCGNLSDLFRLLHSMFSKLRCMYDRWCQMWWWCALVISNLEHEKIQRFMLYENKSSITVSKNQIVHRTANNPCSTTEESQSNIISSFCKSTSELVSKIFHACSKKKIPRIHQKNPRFYFRLPWKSKQVQRWTSSKILLR